MTPASITRAALATLLLPLASCSQAPLSGPDQLGPDHIPATARGGVSAEAREERKFHYDHYREARDGETSTRRTAGATGSVTW
jgi:hypothetical protein